jgi:hypothetical protein
MLMQVILESDQNYQNGTVSYQLTEIGRVWEYFGE